MIAIDVIGTHSKYPIFDELGPVISSDYYQEVWSFFKECVDANIIINVCAPEHNSSRYYSTTLENAQEFQRRCEDTTRPFSMRKFWQEIEFSAELILTEIDFDQEDVTYELVSDNGEVWGQPW